MPTTYLLDTSVISGLVNTSSTHHMKAMAFRSSVGSEDKVLICVVSLGEMQFGRDLMHSRWPPPSPARMAEVDAQLAVAQRLGAEVLEVTKHVAKEYGTLRALFARGVMPHGLDKRVKGIPPELWYQATTAATLKVTENDLWIAAVAIAHDLTLVHRDRDFTMIGQHAKALRVRPL